MDHRTDALRPAASRRARIRRGSISSGRPASRWVDPVLAILALAELSWLLWCLIDPAPERQQRRGASERGGSSRLALAQGLPRGHARDARSASRCSVGVCWSSATSRIFRSGSRSCCRRA